MSRLSRALASCACVALFACDAEAPPPSSSSSAEAAAQPSAGPEGPGLHAPALALGQQHGTGEGHGSWRGLEDFDCGPVRSAHRVELSSGAETVTLLHVTDVPLTCEEITAATRTWAAQRLAPMGGNPCMAAAQDALAAADLDEALGRVGACALSVEAQGDALAGTAALNAASSVAVDLGACDTAPAGAVDRPAVLVEDEPVEFAVRRWTAEGDLHEADGRLLVEGEDA